MLFCIGCEVKDRELEFFKNHQEDFVESAKFLHALRNFRMLCEMQILISKLVVAHLIQRALFAHHAKNLQVCETLYFNFSLAFPLPTNP